MPGNRAKAWIMRVLGRTPPGQPPGQMECHEVGELLQQYLDDHVDDERARRIEEHLEECLRCGMEAETYERIKSTLAAHRPEVPRESVERLRAFGERLMRGEGSPAP